MLDPKHILGQTLGSRYVLVRRIGGGGFADVYEADDLNLNDRVAIKVLKPEFAKRVSIEARIGRKFKHPHVVEIFDMGADQGVPFIVMELLLGRTLDQLIPISVPLMRKFVQEICDALQYAHEQKLVHRDLKLQNIMLVDPGTSHQRFKILDFGIAAQVNAELTLRNATMDGGGTIEYMAPEHLCTGGPPTPQSDIYSIGVILYELLMGRRPFQVAGDSIGATLKRIETEPPPRFREIDPDCEIDSAVESLVLSCLSKNPEIRPATIEEVSDRFLAAFGIEGAGDSCPLVAPIRTQPPSEPPRLTDLPRPEVPLVAASYPEESRPKFNPLIASPANEPRADVRPHDDMPTNHPAKADRHSPPVESATMAPVHRAASGPERGTMLPASPASRSSQADRPSRGDSSGEWQQTMAPGGGRRRATPSSSFDEVSLQNPAPTNRNQFPLLRNAVLVALAVFLTVGSLFALIQRSSAYNRIKRFTDKHEWASAVTDLSQGNFFTHPFIDRSVMLEQVHDQWVEETAEYIKKGKREKAVDQSAEILKRFPDDLKVAEMLEEVAQGIRDDISQAVELEDYPKALGYLSGGSAAAKLAKADPTRFDLTQEKSAIFTTSLTKLRLQLKQKHYVDVLKKGKELQLQFPVEPALTTVLRGAEIGQLIEAGDKLLSTSKSGNPTNNYSAAVAKFTQAMKLRPESDQSHEILLKRATAYYKLAADKLKTGNTNTANNPDVEELLRPALSDLNEVLKGNDSDKEAKKLRSQTYVLRAEYVALPKGDIKLVLDTLDHALTDDPSQPKARDMLSKLCEQQSELGIQNLVQVSNPMNAKPATAESEDKRQQALEHLNDAISAAELAGRFQMTSLKLAATSLYFYRAITLYYQRMPDYKNTLNDLQAYRKQTADYAGSDVKVNVMRVEAMILQAWILSTCPDESFRKPAEAVQTINAADELFKAQKFFPGQEPAEWENIKFHLVRTRAAAAAASGDFNEAVGITNIAMEAVERDSKEWQFHNRALMRYYDRGRPYIDDPKEAYPE